MNSGYDPLSADERTFPAWSPGFLSAAGCFSPGLRKRPKLAPSCFLRTPWYPATNTFPNNSRAVVSNFFVRLLFARPFLRLFREFFYMRKTTIL
jgi:hypothetical protein